MIPSAMPNTLTVRTPTLEIAYEAHGREGGVPVVLLHGFPDDPRAFDAVAPPLASAGYRVLVPYLRGYGPTRFLDAATPRMAQQAAIGQDLLDFMDALGLRTAALAGYDWGGRAGCIAAILAPERVRALVTIGGYNGQDALAPPRPAPPEQERAFWYQWYFNTERGRAGLERNRRELCRLLWREWSPTWKFDDATFERTAPSFDNPDFVDVVIHSYRVRHGNAPSDPRFDEIERRLATRPPITVPSMVLRGGDDHVTPSRFSADDMSRFPSGTVRRVVDGVGHFMPREKPGEVVDALVKVLGRPMRIEIICTGDEVLTGRIVNTNFSYMTQRLEDVGLSVKWETTVGDDRESLLHAFKQAGERADAVIVNGGLGPTVDDLSQEIAAQAAGVELVLSEDWLTRMEDFFSRRSRVMPPNNRKQAMLPATAEMIDNPIGTACGFAVDIGKARFFFTPGVPRELKRMLEEQVIPRLLARSWLSIVETFTGGQIAARVAHLPGAEKIFRRGIVARELGEVCAAVGLDGAAAAGGITRETAEVVARAARRQAGTTHALAVLIDLDEGPDRIEFGGSICLAIAADGDVASRRSRIVGGREWVRLGAVELGLDCLRRHLQGLPVVERIDFEKV